MKENKKNKVILIIVIIMSLVIITWNKSYSYEMNNSIPEEKEIERKEFAIYLETKQNSSKTDNDYTTTETYPNKGYLLNRNKTKCYEYGNNKEISNAVEQSISNGVIDGSIIVTSTKSIYCNIYFDKDEEKPEVSEFTLTGSVDNGTTLSNNKLYTHTTNVTYNVTWTNDDVAQICVSEGETCSNWQEVGSNSKTKNETITISTGDGPKNIYVYLKDKANNISEIEEKETITLDTNAPTITLSEKEVTEDTIVINVNASDTSGIKSVTCKATKDTNEITGNYEGNTCTFSGLESETEYTITGEATDGSGRKNTSNELSITTLKKELSRDEIIQKYFDGTSPAGLSATLLGDMYRFVGTKENVDNYICFGYNNSDKDCNDITNDYMYRIIGISPEGQMKLIKNTAIIEGTNYYYSWHRSIKSDVTWPGSDIYKRLNGLANEYTSIFINSTTSNVKYIKTEGDTTWYDKIDSGHRWLYGGIYSDNSNKPLHDIADNVYKIESGKQEVVQSYDESASLWSSTTQAAIGLMYISDYYYSYATSGTDSSNTNCYSDWSCQNSWLHIKNNGIPNNACYEWTMTRYGDTGTGGTVPNIYAWEIVGFGNVGANNVEDRLVIRPVFYLQSTVNIVNGDGTSSNPFIIENKTEKENS